MQDKWKGLYENSYPVATLLSILEFHSTIPDLLHAISEAKDEVATDDPARSILPSSQCRPGDCASFDRDVRQRTSGHRDRYGEEVRLDQSPRVRLPRSERSKRKCGRMGS